MLSLRFSRLLPSVYFGLIATSGCGDGVGVGESLQPTAPSYSMDYAQNPYVYLYLQTSMTKLVTSQQVTHDSYLQNYGTVSTTSNDLWTYFKESMFDGRTLSGEHLYRACSAGETWTANGNFFADAGIYGTLRGEASDQKICYLA